MKIRIVCKIVLACVLGIAGWYLYGEMRQIESTNPELKVIKDYSKINFSRGTGIDIMGNIIESAHVDNSASNKEHASRRERVAAFILRNNTLDMDMDFWNEVKNHLLEVGIVTVRLVAYCADDRCIDVIRTNPDRAHFAVLEYGGVVDMQALIGADANGDFCLSGEKLKKIKWRDKKIEPLDIAMDIGMSQ